MKQEVIWKPVVGYEGYYEVSNNGEIRSLDRVVGGNGKHKIQGCIMCPQKGRSGYLQVNLCKNGICKPHKIHRLIAIAFIPNPINKPEIDHINTRRDDNRVENLRWVTNFENSHNHNTIKNHMSPKPKSERKIISAKRNFRNNAQNKPKRIYRYSLNGEYIDSFKSYLEAEQSTEIEIGCIKKALNKSYRQSGGYLWRTDKVESCEPYKRRRHTKCRTTQMLDANGVVVKTWTSIRDAAKDLHTTHTRIIRYMNEQKPMDGYWFAYKD